MFFKIGVLKNFADFTENYLFWSLFSTKLQAYRPEETPTQVFSCEISENYTTPLVASSKRFIYYITGPLGHPRPIIESKHCKTFPESGKNSLSVIISPKITLILLEQFIQKSTLLYPSR